MAAGGKPAAARAVYRKEELERMPPMKLRAVAKQAGVPVVPRGTPARTKDETVTAILELASAAAAEAAARKAPIAGASAARTAAPVPATPAGVAAAPAVLARQAAAAAAKDERPTVQGEEMDAIRESQAKELVKLREQLQLLGADLAANEEQVATLKSEQAKEMAAKDQQVAMLSQELAAMREASTAHANELSNVRGQLQAQCFENIVQNNAASECLLAEGTPPPPPSTDPQRLQPVSTQVGVASDLRRGSPWASPRTSRPADAATMRPVTASRGHADEWRSPIREFGLAAASPAAFYAGAASPRSTWAPPLAKSPAVAALETKANAAASKLDGLLAVPIAYSPRGSSRR